MDNNTTNQTIPMYPDTYLGSKVKATNNNESPTTSPPQPSLDINNLLSLLGNSGNNALSSLLPALLGGMGDKGNIMSLLGGGGKMNGLIESLTGGGGANILSSLMGSKKKQGDSPPAKLTTNYIKANEYKF